MKERGMELPLYGYLTSFSQEPSCLKADIRG